MTPHSRPQTALRNLVLTASAGLWLCRPLSTFGQSARPYAIVRIPTLPGRVEQTVAEGINSLGEVVGSAFVVPGGEVPFIYRDGVTTQLSLGDEFINGQAFAINGAGTAVGVVQTVGLQRAAYWTPNGHLIDVGYPGTTHFAEGLDINERGQVAGWATVDEDTGLQRAFRIGRDGRIENLGTVPGYEGSFSNAVAINERGEVVGNAGPGAVLWPAERGAEPIPMFSDPDIHDVAKDLNDLGDAVGYYIGDDGFDKAFVWHASDGSITDIHDPTYAESHPTAINNLGQIVGGVSSILIDGCAVIWWSELDEPMCLEDLLPPNCVWTSIAAHDINDLSMMCGEGTYGNLDEDQGFVMTPVQYAFDLETPVPGLAGELNAFLATGLEPGTKVHFLYGEYGGGTQLPGCPLTEGALQIEQAQLIGSAVADENGTATLRRFVPSGVAGREFLLQAVVKADCALSSLVVHEFE